MSTLTRFLIALSVFATTIVGGAISGSGQPVSAATSTISCDDPRATAPITSPPLASYTPITPVRVLDTRNAIGGPRGELPAGCTIKLSLGADVPAGAQAVALSLTSESGVSDFMTVYPCALGRPESSNLNFRSEAPTANLVVAIPDADRQVCIYSHGRTHVIVDVSGWWSDGPDRLASVEPQRVYDSRRPGMVPLSPGVPREIEIVSPDLPDDATAVLINLTTTQAIGQGFFTAYPCGNPVPNASNLNFAPFEDRAVAAIVGLGPGRKICVVSNVLANVVVDLNGYYAPAPQFGPTASLATTSGERIVDTRNGIGGPRQPFGAFEVRAYDPVAGLPGADQAAAVTLNVISAHSTRDGFVTMYPCGGAVPDVSSLNYRAGQITSNLATIQLGDDRTICVQATTPTDIIIDVYGTAGAPPGSLAERIELDADVFPPFDPAATDYAIDCGAGSTEVTIRPDMLPGAQATVAVDGGAPAPVAGSIVVDVEADDLVALTTSRGSAEHTAYFRCLPADFPDLRVDRPGRPAPGWYLTTFGANGSPGGPYSVIFDEFGAPVWYKRVAVPVVDLKRLSTGELAYIPATAPFGVDPSVGYWITRLDGTTVRRDRTSDPANLPVDHHDYLEIPGGRAMLTYPTVDPVSPHDPLVADLTALNPPVDLGGPPGPAYTATQAYADSVIEEVGPSGDSLWLWRTADHIPPQESTFPIRFLFLSPAVDVYHVNSIDRQPDGDYVASARHLDAVYRVNRTANGTHQEGEIEWVLGGAPGVPGRLCAPGTSMTAPQSATNKCLRIVGDPLGGPKRPHDARMVGDILTVYDNRTDAPGASRAVAYRIDTSDPGDITATMLWEIRQRAGATGPTLGSTRMAPDGSVLVGWSEPIQPMYEEFAADKTTRLMSITQSPFGYSYRIVKEPKPAFDTATLRSLAGGATVAPPP